MKRNRLATKLGLIFLGFALLVLIAVGVTFWGLNAQKVDAVVINLAGRQRMLIQQMTLLAVEIKNQGLAEHFALLQESQRTFEETLTALRDGGSAPYLAGHRVDLPKTNSPSILEQIAQVEQTWQSYREQIAVIMTAPLGSQELNRAVESVESISRAFVTEADQLVRLYETQSTAKGSTLRQVQLIFLISALLLLMTGVWITYRYVLYPLQELGNAARTIGSGELETPVQVKGDVEIDVLTIAMDDMRSKLLASQQELRNWANLLEERVTRRTQEIEALNTVSREISSGLNIENVLNSVVEKSRQLLGADVAFLCLLDDHKKMLSLQSTSGSDDAVAACDTAADATWARQVITSEQAVRCEINGCHGFCHIVAKPYRDSHLATPLTIGNRVIGALCVASQQPDYFSDDAAGYLTRLANIASVAIENARLYAQLERSAALEERHRIAADMHDGLAQTLSFLRITAEQVDESLAKGDVNLAKHSLERVQRGVEQASSDIRRAIDSLHDQFPQQFTLQEQLSSLVDEFKGNSFHINWDNQANIPLILAHPKAEQVLRVLREALINTQKHSQATEIWVKLTRFNGTAIVNVEDNGVGFNPQNLPLDDRPRFGLKIMQARAARLGGKVEIHSQPNQGTQIVLSWPLEEGQNDG
jgi:two-component system, NarL family, nitrate/nitrite sensor histidine kinase NarX